jgi:VanZ family protein
MKTQTHNKAKDAQARGFSSWLRAWGPVLVWMGVIFYLSDQPKLPGPESPFWNIVLKKMAHFIVYGILAWLVLHALNRGSEPPKRRQRIKFIRWYAWGIAVLYAISDEFHQSLVPGRHPKVLDLLIDACGAGTVLLVEEKARAIVKTIRKGG